MQEAYAIFEKEKKPEFQTLPVWLADPRQPKKSAIPSKKRVLRPNLYVLKAFMDVHFFGSSLRKISVKWNYTSQTDKLGYTVEADGSIVISWWYVKDLPDDEMLNMVSGTLLHEMVHSYFICHELCEERYVESLFHGESFESKLKEVVGKAKAMKLNWVFYDDDLRLKTDIPAALKITEQCSSCKGVRIHSSRQLISKNQNRARHYGCEKADKLSWVPLNELGLKEWEKYDEETKAILKQRGKLKMKLREPIKKRKRAH